MAGRRGQGPSWIGYGDVPELAAMIVASAFPDARRSRDLDQTKVPVAHERMVRSLPALAEPGFSRLPSFRLFWT
jgi:hypothetical protein